ncbi:hypothetical protein [Amycolatopsis rubida]|uniref:Uncharacterized protein n=1 Tax=Amycolatopsis rubida TaxID=112413 RepID=A0A1I5X3V5_9PSEU|nr:hypothetical protein [Amycolatopsis rubida]SFQ26663.1 hypothetical protein SAMN05421854_11021 [Amycolatopsis rubida]
MVWEWVAPVGTVLGASITAGFGGWLGGRQSRKNQERQHKFERKKALAERGQDKVDQAAVALRFLGQHASAVAHWRTASEPVERQDDFSEQHDRIGLAIPYLLDEQVRRDIELVHDLIQHVHGIQMLSRGEAPQPVEIVSAACREGLLVLGRYLRQEPWEPSAELASLREVHDKTAKEWADIQEENKAYEAELREAAARRRRAPKPPDVDSADN